MIYFGLRSMIMVRDERILDTRNRIAAKCFNFWYFSILISLLYRQFYLKQSPQEYWDIALLFFTGTIYVSLASYSKGAVPETAIYQYGKWTVPVILITILLFNYFQGNLKSIFDFLGVLLSALAGTLLFGLLFHFLFSRWKKQNELND
jgi:hypothetical protein